MSDPTDELPPLFTDMTVTVFHDESDEVRNWIDEKFEELAFLVHDKWWSERPDIQAGVGAITARSEEFGSD